MSRPVQLCPHLTGLTQSYNQRSPELIHDNPTLRIKRGLYQMAPFSGAILRAYESARLGHNDGNQIASFEKGQRGYVVKREGCVAIVSSCALG